jgi:hypothetical protein
MYGHQPKLFVTGTTNIPLAAAVARGLRAQRGKIRFGKTRHLVAAG